jgi:putative transposase
MGSDIVSWLVNAKRVLRLYREEGLGLRRKFAKKRVAIVRGPYMKPERMNQLWAMDIVADRLEDGRSFRILTLIDAYTREALCGWPEQGAGLRQEVTALFEQVGDIFTGVGAEFVRIL